MNEYLYDNLAVGQEAVFSRVITEKMMSQFREISGDDNPLHRDSEFAREHNFGGGGSVWYVKRKLVFCTCRRLFTRQVLFAAVCTR